MASGTVELTGDVIHVTDWECEDRVASDLFRNRPADDWGTLLCKVVRIGALAVRDAGEISRLDYARVEFNRFLDELHNCIDLQVKQELQRIFEPDKGVFSRTVQEFLGPNGTLAQMFDDRRSDSIAANLRSLLEQNLTGENSAFIKALDPNRSDSPIGQLRKQLATALEETKLIIVSRITGEEAVEEISSRTPMKGQRFEDALLPAIKDIANVFGDSVEDVRTANKDGDFLVNIDPKYAGAGNCRIAFEAKDRSVTLPQSQRELENAKREWGAAAAVMVFAMPEQCPQDASFRHTAQGYLCVYDKDLLDSTSLQIAYQLARLDALRGIQDFTIESVRLAEAKSLLDQAAAKLREIASLKSTLTGVTKTISEVYLALENLQQDIGRSLVEARICLSREKAGTQ